MWQIMVMFVAHNYYRIKYDPVLRTGVLKTCRSLYAQVMWLVCTTQINRLLFVLLPLYETRFELTGMLMAAFNELSPQRAFWNQKSFG